MSEYAMFKDDFLDQQSELSRLRAENAALRADAERYRWWKQTCNATVDGDLFSLWIHLPTQERDHLDAAIDAARKKGE